METHNPPQGTSRLTSTLTRGSLLRRMGVGAGTVLAASAFGSVPPMTVAMKETTMTAFAETTMTDSALRPFRVNVPDEALVDLRRRLAATRWPERETVTDRSQGNKLATMQALVRYWASGYDWRRCEAKLNALPQFMTEIDGLDIHYIHVRSKHENALPLIVTHGWPGSVIEQMGIIDPLTNPTAYGASAADAFHLVIPSMPGYGFSGKPTHTGWDPDHIGRAWAELMSRLGYTRYVAQGGDWGSPVSEAMGRQAPAGLLGIHINLPATVPSDIGAVLNSGGPAPAGLSADERAAYSEAGHLPGEQAGLLHADGHAAADDWLRLDGFAGGVCGLRV